MCAVVMNIKKPYIYLIGCMSYYHANNEFQKATEWRNWFINQLVPYNFRFFDPTINFKLNMDKYIGREIVVQNDYYLQKCDIGIINLQDLLKSPGSLYELFNFKFNNKPVIAFGELFAQPHVNSAIAAHFSTKEEIRDYLITMYV